MILQGGVVKASLCLASETRNNPVNAQVVALMLETITEWLKSDEHARPLCKQYVEDLGKNELGSAATVAPLVLMGMLAGLTQGVQAQIDSVEMHDQPQASAAEQVVH